MVDTPGDRDPRKTVEDAGVAYTPSGLCCRTLPSHRDVSSMERETLTPYHHRRSKVFLADADVGRRR